MVAIEADKSARWMANHCLICLRELKPSEPRHKTTAELLHGGRIVKGNTCESCVRKTRILQGAESIVKGAIK